MSDTRFYSPCPECVNAAGYKGSCHGHAVEIEIESELSTVADKIRMPWQPTFASLIAANRSIRRLLDQYWHGYLSPAAEAIVESEVSFEIRLGYKPSDYH